ncbi:patatin-like phospholipase family protein [Nitratireductor mangrovi]|uniref:Patatin-like phospholipase family protein n=1 Tax=Nitratireductor mangrovi TaxID=2599600 RepID=A0A5B8KWY3_9HYPH|nr:patatin-like phospholipase family protein [Nitratireductor mangrovi]QDZ00059.1 patatin-like phospholipase family protein [Nitratireductor mangrovi]
MMPEEKRKNIKQVNVALQGGGSHGAFTWGVLDGLLEDGRIGFAAISGTSAGAMNAVALADGWVRGGADGARQKLYDFWRAVAVKGRFSPVQRNPWDMLMGNWSVANTPGYLWFDAISRTISPYLANPLNINPLREVVEREIDFGSVRSCDAMQLFISATNVQTGKLKVFSTSELSRDVVMASACLPHLFQAVTIDGTPYWDGGYGGNPAIYPFFGANHVEDVLLVQINPVNREAVPLTANEIQNRIDEITFNASLLSEFRAIAFVKELIAAGRLGQSEYRDIRMHRIDADEALKDLTAASKVNAEWAFLEYLRDLGRSAAQDWLAENFDALGVRQTLPIEEELDKSPSIRPRQLGKRVREFLARREKPAAMRGRHG